MTGEWPRIEWLRNMEAAAGVLHDAGIARSRAAIRTARMWSREAVPAKRRRLTGKQDDRSAISGRDIDLTSDATRWDAWAVADIMEFRLAAAAAVRLMQPRGPWATDEAVRTIQGLANHVPEMISHETGMKAKWHKFLALPSSASTKKIGHRLVEELHDDLLDIGDQAHRWHHVLAIELSDATLTEVLQLETTGAWEEALTLEDALIEPLNVVENFRRLALHLRRLAERNFVLLRFDKAEEYANYAIDHESPVARTAMREARQVRARVAEGRARLLCCGTAVHVADGNGLFNRMGHVIGRPGADVGDFSAWTGEDVYEVRIGQKLHVVPWANIARVEIAVLIAVHRRSDGPTRVTGSTLGGTICAQFDVDPMEISTPRRLVVRAARAMGRHTSNITCIMPDGTPAGPVLTGPRL